ncbi:urease accessory protein UreD [Anthocerotibacter panamensis]|uniref:urease accessory protein UreD n=1 Tax=Anthocerotibacter panamensis TaxID=2857077 RepID=UPI001C407C3B|nr:urease accessory protein UreD [Anthocerotibacter panamensis]
MPNLGLARAQVAQRNGRSVVTQQYGQAPLQWHRPLYLEQQTYPTLYLRTPSAGLLGGDVHDLEISVGASSTLEVRTQAATMVYPGISQQTVKLHIAAGGKLVYLPHPLILAAGADFRQRVHIDLAPDSWLEYQDVWAAGRIAMGEQWQFERFDTLTEIYVGTALAYRERWVLQPTRTPLTHPLVCGKYTQFRSVYRFGLGDFTPISYSMPSGSRSWVLSKPMGQICRIFSG